MRLKLASFSVAWALFFVGGQVNFYNSIFYAYWCESKMVLIQDGSNLNKSVLEKAIEFWQPYLKNVHLEIRSAVPEGEERFSVVIRNKKNISSELDKNTFAQFKPKLGPREVNINPTNNLDCYQNSQILIFPRFYKLPLKIQKEFFAHEVGHALGLGHIPGTIMDSKKSFGFHLNWLQKTSLTSLYGG